MQAVQVNPEILRWAREAAGLSLEAAARKLQFKATTKLEPSQKLELIELGKSDISRPLLIKMSKQYHRPLITFYLENPPIKGDRGQDFRQLPENYHKTDEGLVDALVRDVRVRQNILKSALEDEDEAKALTFVGSANVQDGIAKLTKSICDTIGFSLKEFRSQKDATSAFTYLRNKVESVGVFVLMIGDLGSHHTSIPVDAFRGFAISDKVAPFVIINDHDAKSAWSFTLLHELAHIWLGQTGISGAFGESAIERFCNDVASSILLFTSELAELKFNNQTEFATIVELVSNFAKNRHISRSMIAYRLYRSGVIDFERWHTLKAEFKKQWEQLKAYQKTVNADKNGAPSYYVVRRHRIGNALVDLVARMTLSGTLTFSKAGKVLGVKPRNVFALIQPSG